MSANVFKPLPILLAVSVLAACASRPYRVEVPPSVAETEPLARDDVLRMSAAGVDEQVIIEKLRSDGFADVLSPDDIISLKENDVSDALVEAMIVNLRKDSPAERYVYYYYGYPWSYYPAWGPYYGYWHYGHGYHGHHGFHHGGHH